jgi:hypothetical protein
MAFPTSRPKASLLEFGYTQMPRLHGNMPHAEEM